jgi:hypothetical protein
MTRSFLLLPPLVALLVAGCRGLASRSSDDIIICKQYVAEAGNRMLELKCDTFKPADLTFSQLHILTPTDPDWRDAQFFVLNAEWGRTNETRKIVIVCGQSRVSDKGERVHCVGYSTGETAWLGEDEIAGLELKDFSVLPKIRP